MRRSLVAVHALILGGMVAVAACFPDPPTDTGIADSGIFLSDGSFPTNDDSSTSGLTLSTQTVDFGLNECAGVAPPNQKLTLTNTSSGPVTYGAAAAGDQFSIVGAPTGTIPAGQSADITIASLGVSAFATAGGIVEGALQVVTDAPGQKLFVVDLRETAEGSELTLIPNMNGSIADFGAVASGDVAKLDIGFRNNGNEPIDITFDDTPNQSFTIDVDNDAGTRFTVAANSTTTLHATYTADQEQPSFDSINFHTTGVLCGGASLPSTIQLQGHPSFPGSPDITPGVLTFDVGGTGFVPCGKAATAQKVTVSNPMGTEFPDLSIIDTIITGPFTVSPSSSEDDAGSAIAVASGTSTDLTITPQTVSPPQSTSPDGVDGTLQINLSNETTLIVQLSQTAQGAVLAFAQPSIDFGAAPLDFPTMQLLGITNSGNAAVGVTLAINGSPYFTVSPSAQFSVNTPGGASTVTFLPIAAGAAQGQVLLTASGPVCGFPSPATVGLTGNGSADAGIPDSGFIIDSGIIDDSGLLDVDTGVQ